MILLVLIVGLIGGFGAGRVKNAGKLKAVAAHISAFESGAITSAASVISKIKSIL